MSVSFEEALETLVPMFGDWDRETLALVLESQNYRLESAIEFILESGGPESQQQSPPPAPRYGDVAFPVFDFIHVVCVP